MKPVRGVVIGAGDRGAHAYTPYLLAHADEGKIVAVAEPQVRRRERFARRYGLAAQACYEDWRALLAAPRTADFALVATQDDAHVEPAKEALERGYHVLLEKPMALTEADCRALVEAAERTGRLLQICHVTRYAPFFATLKQIVLSGEIGDVVTIQHSENVSYWHYAHSYCRGSWRNRAASSPMILAKSCHDLDLLYWLAGAPPAQLVSLARPTELTQRNAPEGAPEYCIEGCRHAEKCPYDAVAMYRDLAPLLLDIEKTRRPLGLPLGAAAAAGLLRRHRALLERLPVPALQRALRWNRWPVSAITDDPSPAGIEAALRTTRYGRCVYRVGDNDQVSSQTVNVLFANGVNAGFTMHSTSHREGRETRIDGTRGSVWGGFYNVEQSLTVADHKSGRERRVRFPATTEPHGGGDSRLFAAFLAAVRGDAAPLTTARESLQSHLMAFAADRAAREGIVVRFPADPRGEPA